MDEVKSNTNNKEGENTILEKQDVKMNKKLLLKEKEEITNIENNNSQIEVKQSGKEKNMKDKKKEDYGKMSNFKKEETKEKEEKETHLNTEQNNEIFRSKLDIHISEIPEKKEVSKENNEIKAIKDFNISQKEPNKNEINEKEKSEEFNDQKEQNVAFENYDLPKNAAYLRNNYYY